MRNYGTSTNSCWMSLFELWLHLFTRCWRCKWPECVCMPLYMLWILQHAHLVAMCQCHRPLCSPSGCFTHSASRDSCSIRKPSRTTDTQTKHGSINAPPMWVLTHRNTEKDVKMGQSSQIWLVSDQKRILQVKKKKKYEKSPDQTVAVIFHLLFTTEEDEGVYNTDRY